MSLSAANRRDLARAAWSGGLAIAMTGSVLVVGALLPTAVADHGDDPLLVEQNITECAQIENLPESAGHGQFNPVTEDDNNTEPGVYPHLEATVEVFPDGTMSVTAEPGHEITAVAVKGTPDTNVYFNGPFENLVAPESGSGEPADISHYTVCSREYVGTPTPTTTTTPPTTPPTTEPPTTTPPTTTPPTTEPPTTPPTTPPTEPEEDIQLTILEPICDDDVPYLEYLIEPEGFTPDDVSITWINPDGENVVYEDLPLEGRVLWAGAVAGPNGEPLDWPGWIQLEDGSWIEGDDGFEWVRPSVDVQFQVNPEQTLTIGYPPSSPDCAAEPPQNGLPKTGANLTVGLAGGGLLAGGLVLMLFGRRRNRDD